MSQAWRTVRVFISSTFRDMQAERDHLVRFVFPRLREVLLRHRLHLVDIDLRWGVTSEQDASEVCREIVDECRPHFLCILGGRYGWVPPGRTRSITADEVYYGVLDRSLAEHANAYFYFRDDAATARMREDTPGEFREPEGSESQRMLASLKEAIVAAGLNAFRYPAEWDDDRRRLTGLQEFGARVYSDLLAGIKGDAELADRFGSDAEASADEFAEEDAAAEAFVQERCERFVLGSRDHVLQVLLAHAAATGGNGVVCVTGAPGSGKSALLAHLSRHPALTADPTTLLVSHFAGASPGSTDARRSLRRLCHTLAAGSGDADYIPEEPEELRRVFSGMLARACGRKRVVILVDAIDRFDVSTLPSELWWLTPELPGNARVILSALPGPVLAHLRREARAPREVRLRRLTTADGEAIIEQFRERYRKTLEPEQRTALLAKRDAGTPLYLLAALEELRTLGTYEEISARTAELPPTTRKLFSWILRRLQDDDGFRAADGHRIGDDLVPRFAGLLAASRHGLSQHELSELLAPTDPASAGQDAPGNVAALLHLLRPYLMRRGELLDFYHGQLRLAAAGSYLRMARARRQAHEALAGCFRRQADPTGAGTWQAGTPRGLSELPYHLSQAHLAADLFALARAPGFLDAQAVSSPEDPDLPQQTLRYALELAGQADHAAAMAEFALAHARRLARRQRQETPLQALLDVRVSADGALRRAWGMADLCEPEMRTYWLLLLTWKLQQLDRSIEAALTLRRFGTRAASPLQDLEPLGGLLLPWLQPVEGVDLVDLAIDLDLSNQGLRRLGGRLCQDGAFAQAEALARRIEDIDERTAHLQDTAIAMATAGLLAPALAVASTIEESPTRAALFTFLAAAPETPDDQRDRILNGGVQAAEAVTDPYDRIGALLNVAANASGGVEAAFPALLARAEAAVGEVDNEYQRSEARCRIVEIQVDHGLLGDALATAKAITDPEWRLVALTDVGEALVQKGVDVTSVLELARATVAAELQKRDSVPRQADADDDDAWRAESERDSLLGHLARAEAGLGHFEGARQTAETMGDASQRALVLAQVALAMARTHADSGPLVAAVLALAVDPGSDLSPHDVTQVCTLAMRAQLAAGDTAAALETVRWLEPGGNQEKGYREIVAVQLEAADFAGAAETAALVETPEGRCQAVIQRVVALIGQRADFEADLAEACSLARGIPDRGEAAKALALLAGWQAWAGSDPTATLIPPAPDAPRRWEAGKDWALSQVAIAQAHHGLIAEALRTEQATGADGPHSTVLREIVAAQGRAGLTEDAVATSTRIGNRQDRAKALLEVVMARTEVGDLDTALGIADSIEDVEVRPHALARVAAAHVRAGDTAEALRTCERLEGGERGWGRDLALRAVSEAQAERGEFAAARETLGKVGDGVRQVEGLAAVAVAMAAAGQDAYHAFHAAMVLARSLDRSALVKAWLALTIAHINVEPHSSASLVATLNEALDNSALATDWARRRLGVAQAQQGLTAEALQTAEPMREAYERTAVLTEVALAQLREGDEHGMGETIAGIQGTGWQVIAWLAVGRALTEMGREGAQAFERAQELALEEDPSPRFGQSLDEVIGALAEVGQYSEAMVICDSLLSGKADGIEAVAKALIPCRDGERAREALKDLLPRAAWSLSTAWTVCGVLPSLYLEQSAAIADRLVSEA